MMMLNTSQPTMMMTPTSANTWMPPSSVPLRTSSQPSVPVRTLVPSQPPALMRNQPNPNVYRNKMNTNIMSKPGESKGTTVRLQLGTTKSQEISNGDHDYGGNRTTSLLASRLQSSDGLRINQMNGGQGTVNNDHSYGFGGKNTSGVGGDHNYGGGRTQQREESPEIEEIEEKDPLALDDEPSIEELDPYEDEAPIIPVVNSMVDDDIAADDQDEGPESVDVSSFLAV